MKQKDKGTVGRYYTRLHKRAKHYTIPINTAGYYTTLHYTTKDRRRHYTVLYYTNTLTALHHTTPQHYTTQHNTTQHKTTQRNTTQHNTTQHNTTQHNIQSETAQVQYRQILFSVSFLPRKHSRRTFFLCAGESVAKQFLTQTTIHVVNIVQRATRNMTQQAKRKT